jgi:hypothetical protein
MKRVEPKGASAETLLASKQGMQRIERDGAATKQNGRSVADQLREAPATSMRPSGNTRRACILKLSCVRLIALPCVCVLRSMLANRRPLVGQAS